MGFAFTKKSDQKKKLTNTKMIRKGQKILFLFLTAYLGKNSITIFLHKVSKTILKLHSNLYASMVLLENLKVFLVSSKIEDSLFHDQLLLVYKSNNLQSH